MSTWTPQAARSLTAPQEVQVVIRRPDGTLRAPRIIWIVGDGDRVFIRSVNGRTAGWFRGAIATGTGQVLAGGATAEVTFTETQGSDLDLVDAAYRRKYRAYASIVDNLVTDGPRAATLEVHPA